MGITKHHAIIVTDCEEDRLQKARQKAVEVFAGRLVSEIVDGLEGGQCSFFIAPDGAKESRDASRIADNARKDFLDWIKDNDNCRFMDYVEIYFGGDDEREKIVRSNFTDDEQF